MLVSFFFLLGVYICTQAQSQEDNPTTNITYSVITSPFLQNQTTTSVYVNVDNHLFPLAAINFSSSLLYQGAAPVAKSGYRYEMHGFNRKQQKIKESQESFMRSPVQSNTLYEFFNRSWNVKTDMATLPQILPPRPYIHRIPEVETLHNNSVIATIHIWGNSSALNTLNKNQVDNFEVITNMTYYSVDQVREFSNVVVSLSGRSSRWVPKLSYQIKLKNKDEQNLYQFKRFKLRAMAYDATLMRERLGFAALHAVGLPATEFSYIRLFMENKPVGLYGLIETFQDRWLANEFANGDNNYKSGYLYQGKFRNYTNPVVAYSDLSYYNGNLSMYNQGQYDVEAGKDKKLTDKDFKELDSFAEFINKSTANTSVDEWNKYIDTAGFTRAMVMEDLLGYSDGYMTLADNYYLYSDPQTKQMVYIPTDLDLSLGTSIFRMDYMLRGNITEHPGFMMRPLTKQLYASPYMKQTLLQMHQNLSRDLVNPNVMGPFLDSLTQMIFPEDVEWDANLPSVGVAQPFPGESHRNNNSDSSSPFADDSNRTRKNHGPKNTDGFLPKGADFNLKLRPKSFLEAYNGTHNSTDMESLRGFIEKKSTNVADFYNTTVEKT